MFPEASKKMLTQHLREMESTTAKPSESDRKYVSRGSTRPIASRILARGPGEGDDQHHSRRLRLVLTAAVASSLLHLIGTLTKWGREYLAYEPNTPE
jgi:hypothetical protein